MFDRVAIPPRGSILLALVVFALVLVVEKRKGERKKERKDDFRQLLPSFPPRDIARVYIAIYLSDALLLRD